MTFSARPEVLAARRKTVSKVVESIEPRLSAVEIEEAIAAAAPTPDELGRLARHLETDPEGRSLTSGASQVPPAAQRLIEELRRRRASRVQPPRCALCRRATRLSRTLGDERICERCAAQRNAEPCSECGRRRRVRTRTSDGRAVCGTCQGRDPSTWERCSRCKTLGRVNARAEDGSPICLRCYQPPPRRCGGCGALRPIASGRKGRSLCAACYVREGPRKLCGRCGRVGRIVRKATGEMPQLCHACWWEPVAACSRCGVDGMCTGLRKGKPLCLRCRLADRLDALVPRHAAAPGWFAPLREAILTVPNPRSGLTWVGRSPAIAVLRDLLSGNLPLTHETLDGLPQTSSLRHLRELLVASGALPYRDPGLAGLESLVEDRAASLARPEDRQALAAFGRWRILQRARRRAERGTPTPLAAKNDRARILEAARFLRWLENEGGSVGDLTQADVDAWVAQSGKARRRVRDFLIWVRERGIVSGITAPEEGRREPPTPADGEARWAAAGRLLHDTTLDPADRVAGTLVVLYAQPVSRIARLRASDVVERSPDLFIQFGREEVLMPEPLAALVRTLPWRRQVGISGTMSSRVWLFPGRQANRHLHPEHLRRRLQAIGIECRASRNAALLQLGAEIPAAVLADTLGLNPSTATRWVQLAGGDWSRYAAERARERAATDARSL